MKNLIKPLVIILLLFGTSFKAKSQVITEWGIGASAIYNMTVTGFGVGLRGHLHFGDRWVLAPQIQYFPSFNKYHDFFGGSSVHFNFTPYHRWGIYALGHVSYHRWINYLVSGSSEAVPMTWDLEPGVGVILNSGCIRPFAEGRYNFKWKEGNLRLGIMFYLRDCGKKNHVCPAYI